MLVQNTLLSSNLPSKILYSYKSLFLNEENENKRNVIAYAAKISAEALAFSCSYK